MRILLTTLGLLCAASLGFAAAAPTTPPPMVVTANTILDDLVRQIGGDRVRTFCLIQPGADPHSFEPRPADVKQLVRADLLVVNGLNLEPGVLKLAQNCGFAGPIVVASAGITARTGTCAHEHHHGDDETPDATSAAPTTAHSRPSTDSADPHAWMAPRIVATYVTNIRDALIRARPTETVYYTERTATYLAELDALDHWTREQLATIPEARRKLVTSHDSLGYFADAYGFETIPVAGLSTSAEPNARTVAGIIDLIRHEQVPAVFIELTANPKLVRQIGSDAGVRLADPLYTGSLGAPNSGADTYLGMVRTNVSRIVAALK